MIDQQRQTRSQMDSQHGARSSGGAMALAAKRMWQGRWTLGAACAAILIVNAIAGGPAALGLVAAIVVCAVAAVAPNGSAARRSLEQAVAADTTALGGMTASDLAAAVGDPLIVFDRRGTVVHANAAAHAAFGALTAGTSVQLRFRAPEMQKLLEQVLPGFAGSVSAEYTERVPVERVYKVTATPAGEDLNVFIFKDQSEARRIDRMRADFIANASHELRTPLASISGFIETLRGPAKNDREATEHFLQIMQDQTSRMARLIDDLLSLSRLEMKPFLTPSENVDIRSVIESVIDTLAPLAGDLQVVVERESRVEDATVMGDRDELIQVFQNLLENACKYGQSGGRVVVGISQTGAGGDRELAVTVSDFGPGIPEEHIPRLTERFYRVDAGTSRAQKGTGLGLSIVKHILTRHGAYLSIQSEIGKGAAFTVHFPVASANDDFPELS
jgi:two-component system phosphate regulon sensor histidine kinase PhoR